ncbi:adenylosuccinate synthase [Candidatus Fermentibacteria bacterium]|nr:adenylosuccinate synthase [Candidatus Fermentibacteria bacterium]
MYGEKVAPMPTTVVVGLQWGDEGKGKMVHNLSESATAVARFSGGANAGHTVKLGGSDLVLHQVPTGLVQPAVKAFVGTGCVLDPIALSEELKSLMDAGINVGDRLRISSKVHLVHPVYKALEKMDEEDRGGNAIGTTLRAIGPTYVQKFSRRGIRLEDAACESEFREAIEAQTDRCLSMLDLSSDRRTEIRRQSERFTELSLELVELAGDVSLALEEILEEDGLVIAEGAQGTLLDPDHGTYPYVTCGSCLSGAASISLGIGPSMIDEVVGVVKAYCSRVGAGPFPTELRGDTGDMLREKGHEYGATTGRPRRCGWLDGVLLRYASRLNGCHWLALTMLDVLSGFDSLNICTRYELDPDSDVPLFETGRRLGKHRPVFEELPGWSENIAGATSWDDLPEQAQRYVLRIEELVGVPVRAVSTGPGQNDIIWRLF